MSKVPEDWADQLLRFWFEDHGRDDWFGGGPDFDSQVAGQFGEWRAALRSQPVEAFTIGAATALAAVLLFDQIPRNVHRGTAEAFATDELALAIARAVIARGYDEALDTDQRLFLYLPFEHSEDIDDQRESLRLMGSLDNPEYLEFAQKHFDIVKRFGRFPHRNAALGRADRDGEVEAIAAGEGW